MTQETLVAPAATESTAPDAARPEVAAQDSTAPEGTEAQAEGDEAETAEKDPKEVELARLRRALTKAQRNNGRLSQQAQTLEQQVQQYQQQNPPAEPQPRDVVLSLAQQMAQQMREQETLQASVQKVMSAGQKLPGFDDACNAVNEEIPFYESGRPTAFLDAVMDSDAPAKLLHYLGQNPDLAAELANLKPAQMGRRIERIEAQMKAGPAAKPVSGAPTPAKPISAQRGAKNPEDMSFDEYKAMRKAQGASWSR